MSNFAILLQIIEEGAPIAMDVDSPNSLELEGETSCSYRVEEVLPSTEEDLSPSVIIARVLGTLAPEVEVPEFDPDDHGWD